MSVYNIMSRRSLDDFFLGAQSSNKTYKWIEYDNLILYQNLPLEVGTSEKIKIAAFDLVSFILLVIHARVGQYHHHYQFKQSFLQDA